MRHRKICPKRTPRTSVKEPKENCIDPTKPVCDIFLSQSVKMPPTKPIEAPQQYTQPSRKGKRAWRKNVDVSEVQSGLEIVRDEVIKGSACTTPSLTAQHLIIFSTVGSSPRNPPPTSSPSTLPAPQPSKNPTTKSTNPSRPTKFSLNAPLSQQLTLESDLASPMGFSSLANGAREMGLPRSSTRD